MMKVIIISLSVFSYILPTYFVLMYEYGFMVMGFHLHLVLVSRRNLLCHKIHLKISCGIIVEEDILFEDWFSWYDLPSTSWKLEHNPLYSCLEADRKLLISTVSYLRSCS